MHYKFARRLKEAVRILFVGSPVGSKRTDIPEITPDEIAEVKAFFPMGKFFIFGHARSGTTLLTRLVRVHPKVHCDYQAHFFTRSPTLEALVSDPFVGSWLTRRSNRWNYGRDLSPLVLRSVSDFIMERGARRAGKGKPDCLVGDKSPNSLLDGEAVRLMNKIYPDAKLVFIVRDGRDAALSHRFQTFIDNPQSLKREDLEIRRRFSQNPEPFLNGEQSIFSPIALRRSAEGWVHNIVNTDSIAQSLLGDRYFHLRYEDLLRDPLDQMQQLWSFLGVEQGIPGLSEALQAELSRNPDADWQRQKAGEIADALDKGKAGTWREIFTERDRNLFQDIAGEVLKKWGYEVD